MPKCQRISLFNKGKLECESALTGFKFTSVKKHDSSAKFLDGVIFR